MSESFDFGTLVLSRDIQQTVSALSPLLVHTCDGEGSIPRLLKRFPLGWSHRVALPVDANAVAPKRRLDAIVEEPGEGGV